MTDWFATHEWLISKATESPWHESPADWFGNESNDTTVLKSGVDMEMPTCNLNTYAMRSLSQCSLEDAQVCQVSNALDRAVAHILRSKLRYGLVGQEAMKRFPESMIDLPARLMALS